MQRTLIALVMAFWAIACMEITPYEEPDAEADAKEDGEEVEEDVEICDNGVDDDHDSLIDEEDCVPGEDSDADADEDAPEDAVEDTAGDVPADDAGTEPDVSEDPSEDTGVTDAPSDPIEDDATSEPDVSSPPAPIADISSTFRSEAGAEDAIETQVWGDLTRATLATLPGTPSRLCIFGSWNEFSTTSGYTCLTWSPSYTPSRLWHHRGGDTSFYFIYAGTPYELDLSRFDLHMSGGCYRSSADKGDGTVRYVIRCPANPADAVCDDGLDNDGDGMIDSEDVDCDTIWAPPIVETNVVSGRRVHDCINFSGRFYFNTVGGLASPIDYDLGERVDRFVIRTDATVGGVTYSPRMEDYPGDGEWIHWTLCGFTYMEPAVTTNWGRSVDVDLSAVAIHGTEICRNLSNTRIGMPSTGCGDGGGYTPPGPTGPEVCDGLDNDGDGMVDDGFACPRGSSVSCTTSCGSTGRKECGTSCVWGACRPPDEVCGNGIDDDCDGSVDESPCGSSTHRYELTGRRFTDYVEVELVSDLRASHSGVLEGYPDAITGTIETICVVYGSDWAGQIEDPYAFHTDPERPPCVHYRGDDQSHYIRMDSWATNFHMFVIDDRRNRAWFDTGAWSRSGIDLNTSEEFVITGEGSGSGGSSGSGSYWVSSVGCPSWMTCLPEHRVVEVNGNFNAHRDYALATDPHTFGSFESISEICAVYGSEDWETQVLRTDHEPCETYWGDGVATYVQIPEWAGTFLLVAKGAGGSVSWFSIYDPGYNYSGISITTTGILAFD